MHHPAAELDELRRRNRVQVGHRDVRGLQCSATFEFQRDGLADVRVKYGFQRRETDHWRLVDADQDIAGLQHGAGRAARLQQVHHQHAGIVRETATNLRFDRSTQA